MSQAEKSSQYPSSILRPMTVTFASSLLLLGSTVTWTVEQAIAGNASVKKRYIPAMRKVHVFMMVTESTDRPSK